MLRAGPFSDERVIRLINRRFVPLYFDLSDRGVMADPGARRFVVKADRRLGGGSVATPNLMIMTPGGKLVGQVSNYGSTPQVLTGLVRALDANPEFDKPSEAERKHTDDLVAAEIRMDLLDYDGARKVLEGILADRATPAAVREGACYQMGRLARLGRDFEAMEAHFKKVKGEALSDHVRMERAYRFWYAEEYRKLQDHLAQFPKNSSRYTEAQYYLGLAQFHQDDKKAARETWGAGIQGCSQDPWIYRADWAYVNSQGSKRGVFSSAGKRTSLLNRIGYMGRRNPDLSGPDAKVTIRRKTR